MSETTDNADTITIKSLVFEPLLKRAGRRIGPGLLRSCRVSEDGRAWRLTLREKPIFHDGSLCIAEDVAGALEAVRDGKDTFGMSSPFAPYLRGLELTPQSKEELLIRCPAPFVNLTGILSEIYVGKPSPDGEPVIGTGRYRVEDYRNGQYVRLALVAEKPDAAYASLTFLALEDAGERYQALLDGQIDLAANLELLKEPPPAAGYRWIKATNILSVTCFLNGFEPPFSMPEARLAINLAIDVPAIIQEVWNGLAKPAATVVSPFHFGHPTNLTPHPYDPRRAQELLAACAMPDELQMRTPLIHPERARQTGEAIQRQMEEIGVKINLEVVEDRPRYAKEASEKKIGHMAIFDSSPHSTFRVLQEKIYSKKPGVWWQGVKDDQADELIESARLTVSEKKRKALYEHCLTRLHDAPHWLYLFHPIYLYACRPEVKGVTVNHAGLIQIPAGQ